MINRLRENLLYALEGDGKELIPKTVEAVLTSLECDMCTLWIVNHCDPATLNLGNTDSASLVIRSLKGGGRYPDHKSKDYAHKLKDSFIEYVLNVINNTNRLYFDCDINDDCCRRHLSYETLKAMGLSYLLCIPIGNKEQGNYGAFVKLAYKQKPDGIEDEDMGRIIKIINQAFSAALSRFRFYQKQQLLADLIENYKMDKSTLKDVFHSVIHRVFKNYLDYEGASVYIWDSFDNSYNLLVTTGIHQYNDPAYYEEGEGLTGLAASEKKAIIVDDLPYLEKIKYSKYYHKIKESTEHDGTTFLAVPILKPSNPDDVLGIIRFTNKINSQSRKEGAPIIDYFNASDIELIENASNYLSLNVENYLAEEERKDFISKMSHEFKAPAIAIRVTAERTMRNYRSADPMIFMQKQFAHYMESLIDYGTLQLMQVSTNLFLTKLGKKGRPEYKIGNHPILELIKSSINIIRPIAREKGVHFDNITISPSFPNITLRVDREAFQMIFYNILTNAIKYSDGDFRVMFYATDSSEGLSIFVSDFGIGIPENELSKIFLLGVRGREARIIDADGYGIGLYVVKLIIESFDGSIRVSKTRNPTTFEIKLPRRLYT